MKNENYSFYVENLENLLKKYHGRYLLIKNAKLIRPFNSFDAAFSYAKNLYVPGSFIIQHCVNEDEDILNFVNLNVFF